LCLLASNVHHDASLTCLILTAVTSRLNRNSMTGKVFYDYPPGHPYCTPKFAASFDIPGAAPTPVDYGPDLIPSSQPTLHPQQQTASNSFLASPDIPAVTAEAAAKQAANVARITGRPTAPSSGPVNSQSSVTLPQRPPPDATGTILSSTNSSAHLGRNFLSSLSSPAAAVALEPPLPPMMAAMRRRHAEEEAAKAKAAQTAAASTNSASIPQSATTRSGAATSSGPSTIVDPKNPATKAYGDVAALGEPRPPVAGGGADCKFAPHPAKPKPTNSGPSSRPTNSGPSSRPANSTPHRKLPKTVVDKNDPRHAGKTFYTDRKGNTIIIFDEETFPRDGTPEQQKLRMEERDCWIVCVECMVFCGDCDHTINCRSCVDKGLQCRYAFARKWSDPCQEHGTHCIEVHPRIVKLFATLFPGEQISKWEFPEDPRSLGRSGWDRRNNRSHFKNELPDKGIANPYDVARNLNGYQPASVGPYDRWQFNLFLKRYWEINDKPALERYLSWWKTIMPKFLTGREKTNPIQPWKESDDDTFKTVMKWTAVNYPGRQRSAALNAQTQSQASSSATSRPPQSQVSRPPPPPPPQQP